MDDNFFEDFDLGASGTRREEILLDPRGLRLTWQLRRTLGQIRQVA